jgi:AraC family transcriptional regulator
MGSCFSDEKSRFTETDVWQGFGSGWQQLCGNFEALGFSIEWHDFVVNRPLDWSKSFHPAGLEICLNLCGEAAVHFGETSLELAPDTAGFYAQRRSKLKAVRRIGQRHRFVTIEFALSFLKSDFPKGLLPEVANLVTDCQSPAVSISRPMRLSTEHEQVIRSLRHPPVYRAAQPLWYRAKALEIAATVLYQPSPGEELFCKKVKRLNHERAQKVVAILSQQLSAPPSLQEIGRRVGCSPFHLSRIFAQETGQSMAAYLRKLRLERAALLLRSGDCNVTEAAFEVGYNSLSHFTVAFRQMFGCCPGLYPMKTARMVSLAQGGAETEA